MLIYIQSISLNRNGSSSETYLLWVFVVFILCKKFNRNLFKEELFMKKYLFIFLFVALLAYLAEPIITIVLDLVPTAVISLLVTYVALGMMKARGKFINVSLEKAFGKIGDFSRVLFKKRKQNWAFIAFLSFIGVMYIEAVVTAIVVSLVGCAIVLGVSVIAWNLYARLLLKKHGEILHPFKTMFVNAVK